MHDNVIVSQQINAPVEKVWAAITDKAQMKEWYFDIPDFGLDLHTEFSFYAEGTEDRYHHHGEILEVVPQAKLKHSWSYPELSKDKTIVKWELEAKDGGTLVTLTHKGLENFAHLGQDFGHESFERGWTDIVTKMLKNYLEK